MWNRAVHVAAGVIGAVLVAATGTSAQDYRQTVVVTAAATPIELGSATRSLTIITREQIAGMPVHSVADVLRLAASVDVRARGERGVQSDFAVRGASFGQMLVLVDGVRLNDVQSAHHNGDIPVPLADVERIEVLYGAGSSLFGADAFGGTVNVVTRRDVGSPALLLRGGSFGSAGGEGRAGLERGRLTQTIAASVDRSAGFMYDRDFAAVTLRSRTALGAASAVTASFQRKEFGANNFYGGNAPSREWTNQTLLAVDHRLGAFGRWNVSTAGAYRTHGDRFVFNQVRPELSDNRHRTHALTGSMVGSRPLGATGSIAAGAEVGGDWIRSTNLGDHALGRVSAYGEWRERFRARTHLDAGIRVDHYSQFGTSWSPSLGIGWWPSAGLRIRASTGRAFRVPTFTERYYSDPANLARPEVGPETAWATEAGVDLFLANNWVLQGALFVRAERDVIDWLRATPADRWRTFNVRDVNTTGGEVGIRKTFGSGMFVQAQYTGIRLRAAAVDQLSKYLLDYAPHAFTAAASLPVGGGFRLAPRMEFRRRSRPAGASQYVVLDASMSRRLHRRFEIAVEGTNLLDRSYQEVAGVAMPGAAGMAALRILP